MTLPPARPASPAEPCPAEPALVAFLEERLGAADRDHVAAHAAGCPACTLALERLSSRGSPGPRSADTRRPPSPETLAIAARLAQRPPDPAVRGAGHPAVPRAAPAIPGLTDLEPIGRGGMGVVYRARDTALDRLVAVKVLWSFGPRSDTARARAVRESLMLARLNHPNVVTVHGAGETADGAPYLVMEWVSGPSLQQRIDVEPLAIREAARIVRDLARAIGEVHALGLVHRDIKPDNVLLAEAAATGGIPKLADFGLARPEDSPATLTQADVIAGTPAFMAAEQTGLDPALGSVGPATDIHGLGGVLYAAIVGRPPYEAATPGESLGLAARGVPTALPTLAARCPADLRMIVEKCLRPDPGRRYRSAGDLADDLERFLDGRPVVARPLGRLERIGKWIRRQPLAAAALGLAAVATVLGVAGTASQLVHLRRANAEITRSRDAAGNANEVARRSLARLTDAAVRRLMVRGTPLNDDDRGFLRMVRDDYMAWPVEPDPRTNLRFRADGLTRLARLLLEIDQYGEALATQQPLIATLEQIERLDENAPDASGRPSLERLGAMRTERLIISRLSGPVAAEAAARRALELIEAHPGAELQYRIEQAAVLFELGWHLAALERADEATAVLERGLALLAQIRAEAPDDLESMRLEVAGLFNTGLFHANAGRPEAQTDLMRRLVDSTSATLARSTDVPGDVPKGLCMGLAHLASQEFNAGRHAEGIALLERSLEVCRDWLDRAPHDAVISGQAIQAWQGIAQAHGSLGQTREQDDAHAAAIGLAEAEMAAKPAVFDACVALANTLWSAAEAVAARDQAVATDMLDRAVEIITPWRNLEGRRQEVQDRLARLHVALASVAQAADDAERETRHLEEAASLVSPEHRELLSERIAAAWGRAKAAPEAEPHDPAGDPR